MDKKHTSSTDIPPFLQDLKAKGTGLNIPEGYFDDLESSVMARLESAGDLAQPAWVVKKRPKGLFASFVRPRLIWASAAAFALLLATVWLIKTPSSPANQTGLASSDLSEEDIEQYLLENANAFELAQLADLSRDNASAAPSTAPPAKEKPVAPAALELRPEDLDDILDDMTDEELEQIL